MSAPQFLLYCASFLIILHISTAKEDSENPAERIDLSAYGERIFGYPDNETTATRVASFNTASKVNPEELGTYLEGDILIPKNRIERNGILKYSSRWPGGVIPYEIAGHFTQPELDVIHNAMGWYHHYTCIRFRPRTTEADYISIVSGTSGCWSSVGRLGGRQEVNFQRPRCLFRPGTAIHELMHAVGFFHEQNRHERDSYVQVVYDNIQPAMVNNFQKYSSKTSYGYGVTYDYLSIMHYSPYSFSANGRPTIIALKKTQEAKMMGQRAGFSHGDIQKINAMYGCKTHAKG